MAFPRLVSRSSASGRLSWPSRAAAAPWTGGELRPRCRRVLPATPQRMPPCQRRSYIWALVTGRAARAVPAWHPRKAPRGPRVPQQPSVLTETPRFTQTGCKQSCPRTSWCLITATSPAKQRRSRRSRNAGGGSAEPGREARSSSSGSRGRLDHYCRRRSARPGRRTTTFVLPSLSVRAICLTTTVHCLCNVLYLVTCLLTSCE
jgi:hypothetical protein